MFANTVTASRRADPVNTAVGMAALTGYLSSRRDNNSALIAEISASTACTCSPCPIRARTASTRPDGTYLSPLRPAVLGAKYAYGPCGSPAAQRQPTLPQRRVCCTSDPASTCSTSPSRNANRRRRPTKLRVDTMERSFLCLLITQECVASRHDNQQPRIARVTTFRAANPSVDNRCRCGASPRSVQDRGSVICPPTPPEQTNTASPPRRLT
jgi:hypothetical protein